jgi:hypothetical protein
MIDIEAVEDTLRNWVTAVEPTLEVIFAPSNAPRPALPYIIIDVSQTVQVGWKESIGTFNAIDDSVDMDYSSVEDIFLSINTYGTLAFTRATKLKNSLNRITILDLLYAGGLGFHRASTVNEIPEEVNKKFEERAQFDCYFYARSLDEENIETIRKIEVTNNINDDGATVIIEHP